MQQFFMKNFPIFKKETTSSRLIILVAAFLMAFGNFAFFSNVTKVYQPNLDNIAFLASLTVVFGGGLILLLSTACFRHTIKPVLIATLILSSFTGYFMDSYNVVINDEMIQNVVHTDAAESADLVTFKMILYVVLLGILPSIWVYKTKIIHRGLRKEIFSRVKLILVTIVSIFSVIAIFGSFYASFFREHKPLRFYANPSYTIYSTIKYANRFIKKDAYAFSAIGLDAKPVSSGKPRKLMIFVVGETARADRFSLNGYSKETNPLLKKENVINFSNYWSCGTSTAISVPCMFSIYPQSDYDDEKAQATGNLLDVLKQTGANVLWLDNNSDSKGVALRVSYESYKTPDKNPVCDPECRDVGMLSNLQSYIDKQDNGDIFIVLHQMGNHGPAYYKRYPDSFRKFRPTCDTNQIENCSQDEIGNTYDNAILYTDYFLSKVIELLKQNDEKFQTVMFYVSDHGESLGENGLYLHGMPNLIAPDTQRHVPAVMWFGKNFNQVDIASLEKKRHEKYSHDHIFHTVLSLMGIETSIYEKDLDIVYGSKKKILAGN
jgi:lipid A ethanolaminephosphotransferase